MWTKKRRSFRHLNFSTMSSTTDYIVSFLPSFSLSLSVCWDSVALIELGLRNLIDIFFFLL
jgi:hypothetical protein